MRLFYDMKNNVYNVFILKCVSVPNLIIIIIITTTIIIIITIMVY